MDNESVSSKPPSTGKTKLMAVGRITFISIGWLVIILTLLQYVLAHSNNLSENWNMVKGACIWGAIVGALHAKKHRWLFALLGMCAVYGLARVIFDYNLIHFPPT